MNFRKISIRNRLLCMVLALAMLVSLTACAGSQPTTTAPTTAGTVDSQPTTVPTEPTTQPTEPTTEPTTTPTEPTTQPTEPEPTDPPALNGSDLEYALTQDDVSDFYQMLTDCEALSLVGEDLDAIEVAIDELDALYEYLNAQCSISMILHYRHSKNAELEQQYLDCVDICTEANDAYLQMVRRLYLSDTPAKDMLFEGWTEEDIASLMAYDEQIVQLQQRNAEIGVEYRAATSDSKKIALYIEFVGNNNTIAQFYGYDNYYDYAYERSYDRDYGREEMEQMRQYAKEYLGYAQFRAMSNFSYSYHTNLPSNEQKLVYNFLFEDHTKLYKDYVGMYMEAVPQDLADAFNSMLLYDSMFVNFGDSNPGAFTTMIGDRSYCYFGPGYASVSTVIHEGGHYFASLYSDLMSIPLDLAETHSQGNEWLFAKFLDGNMPKKQYKAVVDYKLYENMCTILMCLMVDEFEQRVYTTDLTGFTAVDFDAIMDEIALQYFPNGDVKEMLADMNGYWRLVVVDQPVYYVSYAVSAIAAMSLYIQAEEDFDTAMASYMKLCQEPVIEDGFLGNIQAAGLYSPFDEEFYKLITDILNNRS